MARSGKGSDDGGEKKPLTIRFPGDVLDEAAKLADLDDGRSVNSYVVKAVKALNRSERARHDAEREGGKKGPRG